MAKHQPEAPTPQAEQDFSLIVEQKRKSVGVYSRIAARAVVDLSSLLAHGERPFDRDKYIYEGCRTMADYSRDNGIEDIALIDKSARPLWVGITGYWKQAYPDEPRPRIHFINPTLFRNVVSGSESPAELSERLGNAGSIALEQLRESGSPLATDPDRPLLLADACMHSGKAVYLTKRVLETAGFTDLHIGVINTTLSPKSPAMPDAYGTDNVVAARCFRSTPESNLVQNDDHSIYSAPVHEVDALHRGIEVRNHIGALVADRFAADQA